MDIERIRGFMMMMRLADKAALVGGGLSVPAIDKPKLEKFDFGDFLSPYAIERPNELALGCTFSPELCKQVANAKKLASAKNHSVFAGLVHAGLMRDPMSVASCEFFSEDPYLTGELLKSFDNEYGIGFVFTDCLGQGRYVNRTIDSRALKELYLYPLSQAGKTAAAVQFDGGYINGEKVYASKKMLEVYSDYVNDSTAFFTQYGDINNGADSAEALMGNGQTYLLGAPSSAAREISYSVGNGAIAGHKLDRCIERTLSALIDAHEFYSMQLDSELKDSAMPNLAFDSSVLLKNDGVLPIANKKPTLFGNASAFHDGAEYKISDPSAASEKLGSLNIFLVTGYEENGVDAITASAVQGSCATSETVVVLCGCCATPLAFCEQANAVLFCPFDVSIKDIVKMLTETAPRGHLPFSWCKYKTAYPVNNSKYTARGDFRYESMYNGYLLFNNFKSELLYPFGHGLDYTEYEFSKLRVTSDDSKIRAEVIVKNIGARAGAALCQAYITLQNAPVYGLSKRLAAFKRVFLERTENACVVFEIDLNDFAVYDESADSKLPLGGKYKIDIGLSSTDIRISDEVRVGVGSRSNAGLSQKVAPSYYDIGGKFEPTAPEIEKLLKVPFIKKPDEYADILPPSEAKTRKQLKKAEKFAPSNILPLLKYKIKNTPQNN